LKNFIHNLHLEIVINFIICRTREMQATNWFSNYVLERNLRGSSAIKLNPDYAARLSFILFARNLFESDQKLEHTKGRFRDFYIHLYRLDDHLRTDGRLSRCLLQTSKQD